MEKELHKKILSWKKYFQLINKLYRKIDWESEKFDAIIAINRGGNIIGTILSHKTRLPLDIISKDQIINRRGKLLILDEISDTGFTFLRVISNVRPGTEFKTASLHIKKHTKYKPDFYVSLTDAWVVYPYEREK